MCSRECNCESGMSQPTLRHPDLRCAEPKRPRSRIISLRDFGAMVAHMYRDKPGDIWYFFGARRASASSTKLREAAHPRAADNQPCIARP